MGMNGYLEAKMSERESLTAAAEGLAEKATTEGRDLTDTEKESLRSWAERCAVIDGELREYNDQNASTRAYAALRRELVVGEEQTAELATRQASAPAPASDPLSWGDAFVSSDAFANYTGRGASASVEVPFEIETRAPITLAGYPAGIVPPHIYTPASYTYASPLLDVVGKQTAGSNVVSWVQWSPNPQTGPAVTDEGDAKPEATMTAAPTSASLDTYAHWKEITRQALDDIPGIRSTVENRLRQGLVVALEGAIAAALTAATLPTATGADLLSAIRVGIATVQASGFATPNAVLLNPADWADIDVGIMGGTLGGPTINNGFWGVRPIAVPSQPAGTATVGDFSVAVQLFTKGTASVYLTDSHADNFIKNILLLLAEVRALATVPDPSAACECTAGATTTATARASGGK